MTSVQARERAQEQPQRVQAQRRLEPALVQEPVPVPVQEQEPALQTAQAQRAEVLAERDIAEARRTAVAREPDTQVQLAELGTPVPRAADTPARRGSRQRTEPREQKRALELVLVATARARVAVQPTAEPQEPRRLAPPEQEPELELVLGQAPLRSAQTPMDWPAAVLPWAQRPRSLQASREKTPDPTSRPRPRLPPSRRGG